MPMIPPSKLSELVLTRRKLFEKIMQNVATRKIQNSIQATGDRMSVTPQQFGMQVGKTMNKQALGAIDHLGLDGGLMGRGANNLMRGHADYHLNSMLQHSNNANEQTGAAMSAGLQDAVTNPLSGGMMGSLLNGNAKNPAMQAMQSRANARQSFLNAGKNLLTPVTSGPLTGTGEAWRPMQNMPGMPTMPHGAGVPDFSMKMAGVLAAAGRGAGKALNALATGVYHTPRSVKTLAAGGAGGYYFGRQHGQQAGQEQGRNDAAKALADLIKNKMPQKKASVLSVLGGLAGGGLGGLAGGAGGGILGALGGGALGGGPGAGLGLLAGGAAGLGAGAHMGGNIGASIGAGFSKKKEKPESDEKEEKSEEKSEDSGDEEVKESAARVLAQLQKNAK